MALCNAMLSLFVSVCFVLYFMFCFVLFCAVYVFLQSSALRIDWTAEVGRISRDFGTF